MVYAVLGEINGNITILRAVLRDLDERGIKELIVLGNILGKGNQSGVVLDELLKRGASVVIGDREAGVCCLLPDAWFSSEDAEVVQHCRAMLSPFHIQSLCRALGQVIRPQSIFLYGSIIEQYGIMENDQDICQNAIVMRKKHPQSTICFYGKQEEHIVWNISDSWSAKSMTVEEGDFLSLSEDSLWMIAPGKVYTSLNGGSNASWIEYNNATNMVSRRFILVDPSS